MLLQQSLVVGSENAFFTLKLDQLLVHQLDMALWRNECHDVNNFARILMSEKFYLKNSILVSNEWAVATRVDLCEEKIILLTMAMIVTMVMTKILIRMPIAHHRTEAPSRNLDSLLHLHNI